MSVEGVLLEQTYIKVIDILAQL